MADIFLSYSRADREIAQVFADALAEQRWSVWWDPEIAYGSQYDFVIERELGLASCVVVLWSARSAASRWVRAEASEGDRRRVLIPVRIERGAKEPLEFSKHQTADLGGWRGDRSDPTYRRLIENIHALLGNATVRASDQVIEEPPPGPTGVRRPTRLAALLAAPTIAALALSLLAMRVHRSTAFDLDLTVSALSVVSRAERPVVALDTVACAGLAVHGLDRGTIAAEGVVTDDGAAPLHASAAPRRLRPPIEFSARGSGGASVSFTSPQRAAETAVAELDRMFLPAGARVRLEVTDEEPPALTVRVFDRAPPPGSRTSASITPVVALLRGRGTAELVNARVTAANAEPLDAATTTLELLPAETGSLVEMVGQEGGPTVFVNPLPGHVVALLSDVPLSAIAFEAVVPGGPDPLTSSISGEGSITSTSPGGGHRTVINRGDIVVVNVAASDDLLLRHVEFDPGRKSLHLRAEGLAASLKAGPRGASRELAITWFDWAWGQWTTRLLALAAWLLPTALVGRAFWESWSRRRGERR